MNEVIIAKCRELAAASITEYKSDHGQVPRNEIASQAEIEGYFTADWRQLRLQGAQPTDKVRCREVWREAFFGLVTAGAESQSTGGI